MIVMHVGGWDARRNETINAVLNQKTQILALGSQRRECIHDLVSLGLKKKTLGGCGCLGSQC